MDARPIRYFIKDDLALCEPKKNKGTQELSRYPC